MQPNNQMQQTSEKKYKTRYDWVGTVIHRELCKKFKFDQNYQVVHAQSRIRPAEWDGQNSQGYK